MSAVGTAVSEFCTNMLASLATAEAACFGGTASQWQAELAATAGQSGESCAAAGAAATAGRITYDSSRASACLSATTATNCAALQVSALEGTALGTPSACDTVLAGTAATGDPCLGDADCAGASYCQVTNDGCTGTCASQNADGVSCDADNRCVSGNCGAPPPGPVNVCATLVIAYANQGEMCGYDTTTNVETVCAGALVCDGTSNVCVTFVPLGGACTPGAYECEAFSYCDASSHTCTANPGVGGACGGQGANVDMNDTIGCMAPTYCNTSASGTGTCTAYLPDGADCSSPEGSAYCAGNCTGVDNGATATCTAACTRY
jgi:hypothetical protein